MQHSISQVRLIDCDHTVVQVRCPHCGVTGIFEPVGNVDAQNMEPPYQVLGQRRCPNPSCHGHIFFVWNEDKVIQTYPPERLDFNDSGLPPRISALFNEAITCHSNGCYIASGILVRKTLEELCEDQGATGGDLYKRIEALKTKVILPQSLFDGLHELRMLGNDAAHFESKTYHEIGRSEIEVALEVTKEILKGVYQFSGLLDRLRGLKK